MTARRQALTFASASEHEGPDERHAQGVRVEPASSPEPAKPWSADWITRVLTLTPFAFAAWAYLFARPFLGGDIFSAPPSIVGIPLGLVMEALILLWAALGTWVVWRTGS